MKRFLIFAHEAEAPGGGWADMKTDRDSLEDAVEAARSYLTLGHDYAEVIDITLSRDEATVWTS